MSFIPASSKQGLYALLAVLVVAVLALFLRRSSGSGSSPVAAPGPPDAPERDLPEAGDDDDEEGSETAAVTSDGLAFLPVGDRDKVQLVPPRVPDDLARETGRPRVEQLGRGDLIASRVVRGAPDHDPWRLEALGRDHEYRAWRFETEEAARAAAALVSARVVRAPREPDGEPIVIGDADYAAARKQDEEIEAELAMHTGDDPAPVDEPGQEPLR